MGNFSRMVAATIVLGTLAGSSAWAGPVRGSSLVLWMDAQDIDREGDAGENPRNGAAIGRWVDKSSYGNHATQSAAGQRPTYVHNALGKGLSAVNFNARSRQFLTSGNGPSLNLSNITAFVVAKASTHSAHMWLFSKSSFSSNWTGYGVAITKREVNPWPHLGLGHGVSTTANGYSRYAGNIDNTYRIVEINYDGANLNGLLDGRADKAQWVAGSIQANTRNLLIGASPHRARGTEFLNGAIAEILIYRSALGDAERAQTREYLAGKYRLPTGRAEPRLPPVIVDWLFQAEGKALAKRAIEEIGWARELASRLAESPKTPGLKSDVGELDGLERRLRALAGETHDAVRAKGLYLAVRQVKRRIMFKNPAVDFTQVLFIDQPYPRGSEWKHEAIHRMGIMAAPGGRLLVLDGLEPRGRLRKLAPEKPGSFWRPDLSFDGKRVLFCYKAYDEKSFHLWEINLDGTSLRQLTSGDYDDIDPMYLPDGHIMFTTTRGNTYTRCGPYIYSYLLARCDPDGSNVYVLSRGNEPDWTPTLLHDGRVIYSRWEYTDKSQLRIQSLWTTNQDGTNTMVLWGNQSVWPDHPSEPRPIPGSRRVIFSGVGHHDWFSGSIGIIDPRKGFNFPHGLTKVTWDLPWAECSIPPLDPHEADDYHASGRYTSYKTPYPLSQHDFLVSARAKDNKFRLYLMDVHGNRELICEGAHNIWHAMPVKPRPVPPQQPDRVAWPRTGKDRKPPQPGALYSADVYQGVPDLPRGLARHLRVFQQDHKTYSTWRKRFRTGGPPISLVQEDGVKRILSVVPVEADGSVHFKVPAGRALHFQLLDQHYRALQTMRSFTGVMPGERRGCVGCHESHSTTPPQKSGLAFRRPPSELAPPPWGVESISYERFVQPVLDRYCGKCHQGEGKARKKLDLTLRRGHNVFKEPYLTLVGAAGGWEALVGSWRNPVPNRGQPGYGIAGAIPVESLGRGRNDPNIYATVRPMQFLSYRSKLIERARSGRHHGVEVDPLSLRRLIAWVDACCPYLGDVEVRAISDPVFAGVERLPIRPRVKTAPVIERP